MKRTIIALLMCASTHSYAAYLSYDDLVKYPVSCSKADSQLSFLREVQQGKHFDQNPDKLSDTDRKYNSRLKATIWWFAYTCGRS